MKSITRIAIGGAAAVALAIGAAAGATALGAAPPRDGVDRAELRDAASASTFAITEAAAVTGAGSEQLFVPISPCRIVDTRKAGGALGSNTTRSFYVSGTTGFAGQGGTSAGCGIPTGATGAAVSFTAGQASGAGRLVAYPAGGTAPNSTMLSYTSAASATSTPTVALRPGTDRQMTVKNFNTSTHLVVDVLGYYVAQMSAVLDPDGGLYAGARVVDWGRSETGVYGLQFDTDIINCAGVGSSDQESNAVAVFPGEDNTAWVYVYDSTGAPVDGWTSVTIIC
ncbi:hypothetical protein ABZ477_13070 [Microbacterium sp. NPDC019599]|uniref:hypothetical protein n=1 Tax=Microbacterium sp. NPDC019599 TaxID=3154690 RepID=UPI0033C63931